MGWLKAPLGNGSAAQAAAVWQYTAEATLQRIISGGRVRPNAIFIKPLVGPVADDRAGSEQYVTHQRRLNEHLCGIPAGMATFSPGPHNKENLSRRPQFGNASQTSRAEAEPHMINPPDRIERTAGGDLVHDIAGILKIGLHPGANVDIDEDSLYSLRVDYFRPVWHFRSAGAKAWAR